MVNENSVTNSGGAKILAKEDKINLKLLINIYNKINIQL